MATKSMYKIRSIPIQQKSKLGHVVNIISFMIIIYKGPIGSGEVGRWCHLSEFVEYFKTAKYY